MHSLLCPEMCGFPVSCVEPVFVLFFCVAVRCLWIGEAVLNMLRSCYGGGPLGLPLILHGLLDVSVFFQNLLMWKHALIDLRVE